jgi:hypothetical protein
VSQFRRFVRFLFDEVGPISGRDVAATGRNDVVAGNENNLAEAWLTTPRGDEGGIRSPRLM